MRPILFDIEADGFQDTVSKVHCIVGKDLSTDRITRWYNPLSGIEVRDGDYYLNKGVKDDFEKATTLIGHNIIGYDLDILKMFYDFDPGKTTIIDTLVWSQTLNPDRKLPDGCPTSILNPVTGRKDKVGPHSVMAWGYRVAKAKPVIHEWHTFTPEILHRCEEDVGIQELIFNELLKEAGLTREDVLV